MQQWLIRCDRDSSSSSENQVNLNVTGSIAKERGQDPTQGLNMAIEYRLR